MLSDALSQPEAANHVQGFIVALSQRVAALTSLAVSYQQNVHSTSGVDISLLDDDDADSLDDWLVDRILQEWPSPMQTTAAHLDCILATAHFDRTSDETMLDMNLVSFPTPERSDCNLRPKWLPGPSGDLDTTKSEARLRLHKEREVATWGHFCEQPFLLPGSEQNVVDGGGADIGLIQNEGVCTCDMRVAPAYRVCALCGARDMRVAHNAGLATGPEQLRDWLYGDDAELESTCLDTSLPDGQGAAWTRWAEQPYVKSPIEGLSRDSTRKQSLYGEDCEIIRKDRCTKEQMQTISAREHPDFWKSERVRMRAIKRNVLPTFLTPAPELLECEAAHMQLLERRKADKECEVVDYERRAEEGSQYTQWPAGGCWPKFMWGTQWSKLALPVRSVRPQRKTAPLSEIQSHS